MHLSAEEALDLIEKRPCLAQMDFWNTHILTCTPCCDQLQEWQEIRNLLQRQNLEGAPEFVIRTTDAMFEPRTDSRSRREVIASVTFDSFAQAHSLTPEGLNNKK